MKQLKFFLLTGASAFLINAGYAQVTDPKQTVQNDATSRVNSNQGSAIDNGLGKAESSIKGLFKKKKKPSNDAPANQPAAAPGAAQGAPVSISAYNNYDFIPGDQVVFFDDFLSDQDGEFPSHWNLGRGQGVINTVSGKKAFLLTDGNYVHVSPLIKSSSYLNDPFTIEFDNYSSGGNLPIIYLYNTNGDAMAASNDQGEIAIGDHNGHSSAEVIHKADGGIDLSGSFPDAVASDNYLNKWHHVSIAFKKNQVKVYLDQYRVLVVPNLGFTPHAIDIEGIGDAKAPIIMANFRIANGGGMNMLGKKFTDAKIITHGINFDIDQSTLKPESMGTLNMIAGVLKENPDLKFEIDGHTDNTGTSPHNLALSQQRSDAVKTQLIAMGIDASRLTTKGFGDSKPISDNTTAEGKANNRRVEFIKL